MGNAGAFVGGPVGAAAGGAVGAASWLIGQGISALFRVGKGPNDNWCHIVKGSKVKKISLKTFASDDGLRWVPYWSTNSDKFSEEKVMSAGQKQDEAFQMYVGKVHFRELYFQDTIFIGKDTCGKSWACFCGGSFNEEKAGKCKCEEN